MTDHYILKETWIKMLPLEGMSWQSLKTWMCSEFEISTATARLYLMLFTKPIQVDYKIVKGEPKVEFFEPLLVEYPTVSKSRFLKLVDRWKQLNRGDSVFEKAKKYYA